MPFSLRTRWIVDFSLNTTLIPLPDGSGLFQQDKATTRLYMKDMGTQEKPQSGASYVLFWWSISMILMSCPNTIGTATCSLSRGWRRLEQSRMASTVNELLHLSGSCTKYCQATSVFTSCIVVLLLTDATEGVKSTDDPACMYPFFHFIPAMRSWFR